MLVQPSAPSIPKKYSKNQELSPTSYQPDIQIVKTTGHSTVFSAYKARRSVFLPQNQSNPGPGEYQNSKPKDEKQQWVFASKQTRPVNKQQKSQNPGPGSYQTDPQVQIKTITVQGFGSTTKKQIPLSNDPHHPYVVGQIKVPPLGTYQNQQEISKQQSLKQKFVSFEIPPKKVPFNVSDPRKVP